MVIGSRLDPLCAELTDLQCRHLLHGINLAILIAMLFATRLDQTDGLDIVGYLLEVHRNTHAPGARAAPIGVEYWLRIGRSGGNRHNIR